MCIELWPERRAPRCKCAAPQPTKPDPSNYNNIPQFIHIALLGRRLSTPGPSKQPSQSRSQSGAQSAHPWGFLAAKVVAVLVIASNMAAYRTRRTIGIIVIPDHLRLFVEVGCFQSHSTLAAIRLQINSCSENCVQFRIRHDFVKHRCLRGIESEEFEDSHRGGFEALGWSRRRVEGLRCWWTCDAEGRKLKGPCRS